MKRNLRSISLVAAIIIIPLSAFAGKEIKIRPDSIDVINYRFFIELQDTTDVIRGTAIVKVLHLTDTGRFNLDLIGKRSDGKGMVVERILSGGVPVQFIQYDFRITILDPKAVKGVERIYEIRYHGIPGDGLIISRNKFGDRTFFGDNWPNRARNWLPVVDHPSDKALVSFHVDAPVSYGIVANGKLKEEYRESGRVHSYWATDVPLPTKVMVIGVSPFAVEYLEAQNGIPVSSWVYPQNRKDGFYDYEVALKPLAFYESMIAPFPFAKLANVQSKTAYGAMENASCIFYSESTVTGTRRSERTMAHEIAHQWYGDAVSEKEWYDVWLSEGFATYLADLYIEHECGRDSFVTRMLSEKRRVIRYAGRRLAPVVDTTLPVSARLLSTNVYEKGAWFLHMLRHETGDDLFWRCLREFYSSYKYSNASTEDFRRVVEKVTGRDFSLFFHQWLYLPGHPVLSDQWVCDGDSLKVTVTQHQKQALFTFPLELEILTGDGRIRKETMVIDGVKQTLTVPGCTDPVELKLDPGSWLLFEAL